MIRVIVMEKFEKIDKKKILLMSAPNILISLSVLLLIIFKRPGFVDMVFLFVTLGLIKYFYFVYKGKIDLSFTLIIKNIIFSSLFVSIIYWLGFFCGVYGFIGLVIFCICISGYMIYRQWDLYMQGVRDVETRIFGKPLDKKYWGKQK